MRNFLVIFRSSLSGEDFRTIVSAPSSDKAEQLARSKFPKGLRCVRVQPR